jgi:hypothetical protein
MLRSHGDTEVQGSVLFKLAKILQAKKIPLNIFSIDEKFFSKLRQIQTSGCSGKKFLSYFFFKPFYGNAQVGFRKVELLSRLANVAEMGDFNELKKLFDSHLILSFEKYNVPQKNNSQIIQRFVCIAISLLPKNLLFCNVEAWRNLFKNQPLSLGMTAILIQPRIRQDYIKSVINNKILNFSL